MLVLINKSFFSLSKSKILVLAILHFLIVKTIIAIKIIVGIKIIITIKD